MRENKPLPSILVVGNYCHDVLIKDSAVLAESLGGAASFISTVLDGLSLPFTLVSKAGSDFSHNVTHPPLIDASSPTTLFHAYFKTTPSSSSDDDDEEAHRKFQSHDSDRVLKRVRACAPIAPSDLPDTRFTFGLAVGVAGEITTETLSKMLDICDTVLVDVQSLIRVFDPIDGTVSLVKLSESGFGELVHKIGFLKASSDESFYVDVDELSRRRDSGGCCCSVVVTNGKEGCTIYRGDDPEQNIPPFDAVQVDPTGAGDSFMGGLVVGLAHGLPVSDAALLGNFFGALSVGQVGLPRLDPRILQAVKDELSKRMRLHLFNRCDNDSNGGDGEFLTALVSIKAKAALPQLVMQQFDHGPFVTVQPNLLLTSNACEEPINASDVT